MEEVLCQLAELYLSAVLCKIYLVKYIHVGSVSFVPKLVSSSSSPIPNWECCNFKVFSPYSLTHIFFMPTSVSHPFSLYNTGRYMRRRWKGRGKIQGLAIGWLCPRVYPNGKMLPQAPLVKCWSRKSPDEARDLSWGYVLICPDLIHNPVL